MGWKHNKMMRGGMIEVGDKVKATKEYGGKSGVVIEKRGSFVVVEDSKGKTESYHESDLVKKMAEGGMVDLFEDYENIPANVQSVLDEYAEDFEDGNYQGIQNAKDEIEQLGYTFDFYVDGSAYGLRPVGVELNELEGYEDDKMAQGGSLDEDKRNKIVAELNELIEYRNKQDVGSKEYDKYSERITNLKNELTEMTKMEKGGMAKGNNEMLRNQVVEAKHHVQELAKEINSKTNVEPWVIAKMERATTDLSDVTHYLDGMQKMAFGGMINDLSDSTIDRMEGLVPNSTLIEFLNNAIYIINDMEQEGFEKDEIMSFLSYKMVQMQKMEYGGSMYAVGGEVLGRNITFEDWKGDTRKGTVISVLDNGDYEVATDSGMALVTSDEIIKMKKGGYVPKSKKLTAQQQAKLEKVLHEYKMGELHSGSSTGPIVKSRKQALAIGLAEARSMAKGGRLEVGVYRVGKPTRISPNLYEQKIVEIFDNGDIATASDYGRKLSDFKSQKYPIITKEQLDSQYKMAHGGSLKPIPSGNKGLPKLPKDVRNKMGFMAKGGSTGWKHKMAKGGSMEC